MSETAPEKSLIRQLIEAADSGDSCRGVSELMREASEYIRARIVFVVIEQQWEDSRILGVYDSSEAAVAANKDGAWILSPDGTGYIQRRGYACEIERFEVQSATQKA